MVATAEGGRWACVLELGGEKSVAGGAVGEVAGGADAFYRVGGEGAEAVGEAVSRELIRWPLMAPFRVGEEMGRGNREPGR
jgi:hypothetical protein